MLLGKGTVVSDSTMAVILLLLGTGGLDRPQGLCHIWVLGEGSPHHEGLPGAS